MLAAMASFLQARAQQGQWRVRIEDIDPPREVRGAARQQLDTLRRFGLIPDRPPDFQSRHAGRHKAVLRWLIARGKAFPCACSRSDLASGGRYPGTCRDGLPGNHPARTLRLRVPDRPIEFRDLVFGAQRICLDSTCGDFVIRRADGLVAYQLAVVVDDRAAGITEVVRGVDLLESTPRQIALYRALGARPPAYMHVPLVVDRFGRKLSKSAGDDPVARLSPARAMARILLALGHPPPPGIRSLGSQMDWAVRVWNPERVPREPFEVG